jgi:NCAIR mutase (PurE)-related protein
MVKKAEFSNRAKRVNLRRINRMVEKVSNGVKEILKRLKAGKITVEEAEAFLEKSAFERLKLKFVEKLARLDVHRGDRIGIPEVILTEGKKSDWAVRLIMEMAKEQAHVIATRVVPELTKKIKESLSSGYTAEVHNEARMVIVKRKGYKVVRTGGKIGLIAAGTADFPVAEEARVFAQEMGCEVLYAYDVGIAGVHRVLEPLEEMVRKDVDAIIVVAGMDAVLPITVKGLVDLPVIGVPTSVGYGIGAKGVAPLLTMLQSCSPGLGVVNIDNGFGAAALACLIANRAAKFRKSGRRNQNAES